MITYYTHTLNRTSFAIDVGEALRNQQPCSLLLGEGNEAEVHEDIGVLVLWPVHTLHRAILERKQGILNSNISAV